MRVIKKVIYIFLKLYELSIGAIFYIIAKRYASIHTKLMHYTDWYFNDIKPSSYKHEINLYNWIFDSSQSQFVEGGVFGRMLIKKNDNVLDLCCGDGSYSYLFFSDISKQVDAVDYNKESIAYAKKHYAKKNINYLLNNLLQYKFKNEFYDVVIWKAGVAYFTKEERQILFNKIFKSLRYCGKLYISTPIEDKITFSANQIEVIINLEDFENEFNHNYQINFKQKTFYKDRTNINYILEKR